MSGSPHSPRFRRWAAVALANRTVILLLSGACSVVLGYQAWVGLIIDNSSEAFLALDSEPAQVLQELYEEFGPDVSLQVVVEGDVFSRAFLERLGELHRALSKIDIPELQARAPPAPAPQAQDELGALGDFGQEGWGEESGGSVVEDVTSLLNVRDVSMREGSLKVAALMDPLPAATDLPALRERVLGDRTLVGQVVDATGRYAVVVVRMTQMPERDRGRVYDEALRIATQHDQDDFRVRVAGLPAMNAELNRTMMRDMMVMGMLACVVAGLILLSIFRHPFGVVGPMAVILQAFVWTLGLMALFEVRVTMVTSSLPAFLTAVGLGDAIHLQSYYRDARVKGVGNREAVLQAVAATGAPIGFTSLTTAVGLISFQFANLQAIRDLGLFAAFAVLAAFALSVTVMPILLDFNHKSLLGAVDRRNRADWLDRILERFNNLSRPVRSGSGLSFRPTWLTLGAGAGLTLLLVALVMRVEVYHNVMTWVPKGMPVLEAVTTLDRNVGGTANVVLLMEPRQGRNMGDRDLLVGLEAFEAHVKRYQDPLFPTGVVNNVTSLLDVVRETWRALHDAQTYGLPDTQRGVDDTLTLFESSGADELARLVSVDRAKALMVLRVRWMDASGYGPLIQHIEEGIDAHLRAHALVRLTGTVHNIFAVVVQLLSDLLRSFGFAFAVITLIMVLILRDLKLGLIAMVPNLLPVIAIMAFMGAVGIPIDINNLMIASIAIGVAVDDTIHFLHQFQARHRLDGNVEAAIDHAFQTTGRAMTMTTLIMIGGFVVFAGAQMINVQRFGGLMALTVVAALVLDLAFMPALLRAAYGTRRTASTAPPTAAQRPESPA